MAEKKTESEGSKGPAKQREKGTSATGGNVRDAEGKRTPLLDINHCTARQLSLIPGVSREVGDRIVATRRRLGGSFQYFDQLHTIKGVTRAVVQALRGRVQVPGEEATPIGEPEGYMRLGPVQSQSSLLSLNSLGDMVRRKAEENAAAKLKKSPKATSRPSYGGKKRTATKQVSTPPRKTVKRPRNVTKTSTTSSKNQGKSTKTPAKSPKSHARPSNRIASRSVQGKRRSVKTPKATRKPAKSPVSSRRPPTGRSGKTKTPTKRSVKKTGASASRSRSRTPRRATKSSARTSSSKPPRPSPRRKKAVSVSPQAKRKTTSRRAATTPRREPVTYKVVTSSGKSTWTYPSRGRATNREPPVLVLKIETSPTQQTSTETPPADTAVATSKTPQVEAEEISVSSGSRSRRVNKKTASKPTEEPSVESGLPHSASATAGSKTPAVPSTSAGANVPTVEVEKDPTKLRSRSSVEAVEKWLESTARYSTDTQQEQGDDGSSRHDRQGMEDITSEYKSACAYPPSTASGEQAKGTQLAQTESQGWNVEGNQTQPSPEASPAKDAEGNDTQGKEKEETSPPVEQVEAGAEVVATPTGRSRERRRRHRHRRSRDEPSPKRRRRSFDSGSYPTCSVL